MKRYRLKLLTKRSGIIFMEVSEDVNTDELSAQIIAEHGTFITLSSTEL